MNTAMPLHRPPLVLVSSCNHLLGEHPFHVAGRNAADRAPDG